MTPRPAHDLLTTRRDLVYLSISDGGVTLHQPERTGELYASYSQRLMAERLGAILAEHEVGDMTADGAHVMVRVDALRRLAAGWVPEGWDADFEAMLAYAGTQGWLSEDGAAVRAHLERER